MLNSNAICSILLAVSLAPSVAAAQITEIIDSTGDGGGNTLVAPSDVAVDSGGNVYVAGGSSQNVFRIAPGGMITEIIDSTGDTQGNLLDAPAGVAVDSAGHVYVADSSSHSVFKIWTPGLCSTGGFKCWIREIIDSTGDGTNPLSEPTHIAVDSARNVYVVGLDNVFKIATPGTCSTGGTPCTITEIIDSGGDGSNSLDGVDGIAVDTGGNVYASGGLSENVFKIATPGTCSTGGTPCTITEIIDSSPFGSPGDVAVDSDGNVYVEDFYSESVFKIATPGTCSTGGTPCTITEIIDSEGDGGGNPFEVPRGVATDSGGNVYAAGMGSNNAFEIETPGTCSTGGTPCTITEIIGSTGDGGGNTLLYASSPAVDRIGNVYVAGYGSDNVFKIGSGSAFSSYNLEIDWMLTADHNHKPKPCEVAAVKRAFARQGITLNVELSNAIIETGDNRVIEMFSPNAFDTAGSEWDALETANRNHAAGTGWHYAIFGHQYTYDGGTDRSSGLAEGSGDEFLVSLGVFSGGIGTPWDRTATLMHEFGHNLGLRHAGDQNEGQAGQYKPNYASVMSYRYQLIGVRNGMECQQLATPPAPFFHLDFSHGTLAQLNETALVETAGIGHGGVDWDCSGGVAGTVARDVSNVEDWCLPGGTQSVITDFDDWSSVGSLAQASASRSEATEVVTCITVEEVEQISAYLAPCPQVDPCDVEGGGRLVPTLAFPGLVALAALLLALAAWQFRRSRLA